MLADEPTGNLDQESGREIIKILRTLNERHLLTIVMVTHDPAIAAAADRTVRLVDGRVADSTAAGAYKLIWSPWISVRLQEIMEKRGVHRTKRKELASGLPKVRQALNS